MRFVSRAWHLLTAGVLSAAVIAGCTASAGDGDLGLGDDSGTQDEGTVDSSTHHDSSTHDAASALDAGQQDSTTIADSSTADTSTADTATSDSAADTGTADASVDAANDADAGLPPVGSPCATLNQIQTESCGACGTASRVCLAPDGGQAVWQDWGACQNQVANGCIPGTMTTAACGLCGMQTQVCQSSCQYAVGACTGQPPNACQPGTLDYQPGLSCDAGGRERSCQNDCTWSNYGNCIVFDGGGNPLALNIPVSVGAPATTKVATLDLPTIPKLNGYLTNSLCTVSTTSTVATYVELFNPTNLTATVSVWTSAASSGTFDTLLASYAGATDPPADRTMCSHVDDDCSGVAPCDPYSLFAGLINSGTDNRVVLPPGGTATLYVGAYSAVTTMTVTVNARTDILQ
jgi:hypothetical protein